MKILPAFAFAIAISFASHVMAEGMIIANKSVSMNTIDGFQLRNILLGKMQVWPDSGGKISACYLDNAEFEEAFLKIVNKTPAQFLAFWNRMAFSGISAPIAVFNNSDEVAEYVNNTAGAICFTNEFDDKNVGSSKLLTLK